MTDSFLNTNLRIVIADDHQMVRDGLQIMIDSIDNVEIIGEASNGIELVELTRLLEPDVLLVDIKMPLCNGIEASKIIKQEFPRIGIVALSSFNEEYLVMDMLNAGAKGYLLKNAGRQEITDAIFAAYKDQPYYSQEINLKLTNMVARGGRFDNEKKAWQLFSARELQIIEMICEEMSSKQIADALGLQTRTVERYRDSVMHKMKVKNTAGLVMYAVRHELCKCKQD